MKTLVCLKSIPREIVRPRISDNGDRVIFESMGQTVNESDEYALEQALTHKAALGSEVVVASVGALMSQDVVYLGLAKGADKGARIDIDAQAPEIIATAIVRAATKLGSELILTGVESWDNLTSQVGMLVAAKLGIPGVYAVTSVEANAEGRSVKVTRELGGGVQQVLEIPVPVVLCVQSGGKTLTYAAPAKLIRARRNPVEVFHPSDLNIDVDEVVKLRSLKITDVRPPERKRQAQLVEGETDKIAELLLSRIKNEAG